MGRILVFVGLVLFVNLLVLDLLIVSQRNEVESLKGRFESLSTSFKSLSSRSYLADPVVNEKTNTPAVVNACPASCVSLVRSATASAVRTQVITQTVPSTTVTTTTTTSKGEFFVPLGTGSINSGTDWTDITSAQATFNASNYGKITAAYFEVFMYTTSGEVSARLFDSSTPAILFTSQVSTTSTSSVLLSAPITLSGGSKNYRVQMKSTIATGVLTQARVRIVVN